VGRIHLSHIGRAVAVAALSLVLVASSTFTASAKLRFTKPVALESFSPARTATGTVYSITRGGDPSDHEWSGEPVIQVAKDGTVYIAGTCCVVAASPVWYSTDGKKFVEAESPGHAREWGIGAEGDLAVDDKGRVYFVDTYVPGLLFSRWTKDGKGAPTWDYTVPVAGVPPGVNDRPWLAYGKKGLYLYVNHVSHTAVYRSTDHGMRWSSEGPLTWRGDALGQPFFPGHIAADRKSNTLWVSGVVREGDRDALGSAVSTDGGATFTESVIAKPPPRPGGFSPIFTGATAVDAAGNGYASWSTFDDEGCDVHFAASTNKGKSWLRPVTVSSGPGCATFPWIAAGDSGKIALAWYETPTTRKPTAAQRFLLAATAGRTLYGGIDVPMVAPQDELPPDAPWYLHVAIVTNADSNNPHVIESRVPTDKPLLLGPLGRQLWDFLQLSIGSDGRAHVTYADKYKDSAPQTWYVATDSGPRLK
jgi:hypothetical protein